MSDTAEVISRFHDIVHIHGGIIEPMVFVS
jgi:hypothetical protein